MCDCTRTKFTEDLICCSERHRSYGGTKSLGSRRKSSRCFSGMYRTLRHVRLKQLVTFHAVLRHNCYSTLCSVHTTRVHGQWTRPVNPGVKNDTRVHGCQKWRPCSRAVLVTSVSNTSREHVCHFWHPCSQSVFGHPETAVSTARGHGSVYRRLVWPLDFFLLRLRASLVAGISALIRVGWIRSLIPT